MVTTLGELYDSARKKAPSSFEAGELFRLVTGRKIHDVSPNDIAAPGETQELESLLEKRASGIPLQYILGEWEFYSLSFKVGPGVLIPRQDTETLVDISLKLLEDQKSPKLLDLCSGTGCVAIAIAQNRPDAKVTALEFSPEAYSYLTDNIKRHSLNITPVLIDLREYTHPEPLDMIVSNPPYIPRRDFAALQREVGHEPLAALDGGPDGLHFFRAIARRYRLMLRPGGALLMEIGEGQEEAVKEILSGFSYRDIVRHRDLSGITRVIEARYG